MSKLIWDAIGERFFETGVSHGVLYPLNTTLSTYPIGYVWNGLTGVTETPAGADVTDLWADDIKYASLRAADTFGATLEAFTYPEQFAECDGSFALVAGVYIGQQARRPFGFSYRTVIGNDTEGLDGEFGYKLHLIYGASAAPSEKAYATINDSPDAITFSWELTTNPVPVTGHKPTASLTIDSTKVDPIKLAALEDILYGSATLTARLPMPDEVATLLTSAAVVPTVPTFVSATGVVTIPAKTGVTYKQDGVLAVTGPQAAIAAGATAVVEAVAAADYFFAYGTPTTWSFTRPAA